MREVIIFACKFQEVFLHFKKYLGRGIDMREEVTDRFGNAIYLTDERWEHIVEEHSELEEYRTEVLSAIRSGKRRRDTFHPEKFYYKKRMQFLIDGLDHMEVVVAFRWQMDKPNNFVVTAYPK